MHIIYSLTRPRALAGDGICVNVNETTVKNIMQEDLTIGY